VATGPIVGAWLLGHFWWGSVFLFMVPVAAVVAALVGRAVPAARDASSARIDWRGLILSTAGMGALVLSIIQGPTWGWGSGRTLGSLAGVAAILAAFIAREQRTPSPLIRLGIFRTSTLVRANLGAMALAAWIGFQFIATLYMQQLRGWSSLETGLAIFPAGALVAVLSPRVAPLIGRFGVTRLAVVGLSSLLLGYVLFLPIGLGSSYALGMLPTFLLAGLGFGLAFGPLNVAATSGVAPEEQGLAGGLVNTSFQLGAALVLAIVTAVVSANTTGSSQQDILSGYKAALFVAVGVALLGVVAMLRRRPAAVADIDVTIEDALEEAA